MTKRYRKPEAKEGELLAKYGKFEGDIDIFYCWNGDHTMKPDTRMLSCAFERTKLIGGKTLREELIDRGYDITTLKFSIMKKTK